MFSKAAGTTPWVSRWNLPFSQSWVTDQIGPWFRQPDAALNITWSSRKHEMTSPELENSWRSSSLIVCLLNSTKHQPEGSSTPTISDSRIFSRRPVGRNLNTEQIDSRSPPYNGAQCSANPMSAHFAGPTKMDLGSIMWTPLLPSTSSVMWRSAATLESM
jgi:hypothetical protein